MIKIIKVFLLLFSLSSTLLIAATHSSEFRLGKDIEKLAIQCLSQENLQSCREAIYLVHKLQLNSKDIMNYPCQTRLLGLEANLIMGLNKTGKKNKTFQMIKQVKRFC